MARAEIRGRQRWRSTAAVSVCVAVAALSAEIARGDSRAPANGLPNLAPFPNASGVAKTFSTHGAIDLGNPFFQDLGTNGRSCASCHQPADGWSITPRHVRARFEATQGNDPVFRTFDGANCPTSTSRRRGAAPGLRLLLSKGLIRIPLKPPGCRVRRCRRGQPLRLLEPRRGIRLSPPIAEHQSAVPQHAHVGRPRVRARMRKATPDRSLRIWSSRRSMRQPGMLKV